MFGKDCSQKYFKAYIKLKVTPWRKTQATGGTCMQHINNLFGLFLNDLEKENRCIIPSCVTLIIREKFPQEDGIHIPFEWGKD